MTTNLDYVGCGNFNQSVLSRMSLIQPKQNLTEEEMKRRVIARTGYGDEKGLNFMVSAIQKIHAYLKEEDLQDIHSKGWLLKHKKTGARLVLVENDDENKIFRMVCAAIGNWKTGCVPFRQLKMSGARHRLRLSVKPQWIRRNRNI